MKLVNAKVWKEPAIVTPNVIPAPDPSCSACSACSIGGSSIAFPKFTVNGQEPGC